jgi:hypothetical protein
MAKTQKRKRKLYQVYTADTGNNRAAIVVSARSAADARSMAQKHVKTHLKVRKGKGMLTTRGVL